MKRCYICDCTFKLGTTIDNYAICNQCEEEMAFEFEETEDDLYYPLEVKLFEDDYYQFTDEEEIEF